MDYKSFEYMRKTLPNEFNWSILYQLFEEDEIELSETAENYLRTTPWNTNLTIFEEILEATEGGESQPSATVVLLDTDIEFKHTGDNYLTAAIEGQNPLALSQPVPINSVLAILVGDTVIVGTYKSGGYGRYNWVEDGKITVTFNQSNTEQIGSLMQIIDYSHTDAGIYHVKVTLLAAHSGSESGSSDEFIK